jgi:ankyrin repeat protein
MGNSQTYKYEEMKLEVIDTSSNSVTTSSNNEKVIIKSNNSNYKIKTSLLELCKILRSDKKDNSHINAIKKIINDCPAVAMIEYQDKFELYPLNILFNGSSKYDTTVILKILLENNFELRNKKKSPFLCSVVLNIEPSVKLFLEHGSDPNNKSSNKETPLMLIYERGTPESVYNISKALIIKGADVNLCNSDNTKTIITYNILASITRNIDFTKTLKLLLDNGADSNYHNKNNRNVLISATNFVKPETNINILIKIFQLLLKYKLDINITKCYTSLLGNTCSINHPEKQKLILLLLENGADINIYSKIKNTPPFFCLLDGNSQPIKDILQLFIERKVDFNHKNNDGYTFLMKLVKTSRDKDTDDSIKMLLELGLVDPNIKGPNDMTALQIASENCLTSSSQTTIDLLLEYGAV